MTQIHNRGLELHAMLVEKQMLYWDLKCKQEKIRLQAMEENNSLDVADPERGTQILCQSVPVISEVRRK